MIINSCTTIIPKYITPAFKSYTANSSATGLPAGTSFYRDYATLKNSVNYLEQTFPDGADILVYAGSDGEEAISIYSMMKNPQKYNIYSIDPCQKAIEHANMGVYQINYSASDNYLLNNNDNCQELRNLFHKCLRPFGELSENEIYNLPTEKRKHINELMDRNIFSTTYLLKPEVTERIKFIKGDIRDIDKFKTEKPIGGIYFRNALYHITKNIIIDIKGKETPNDINRAQILKDLITSVERKLANNGIFVMGHNIQEHIYLADYHTHPYDIFTAGTKQFVSYPLNINALETNGHFASIGSREIRADKSTRYIMDALPHNFPNKIPLIWRKIK